MRVLFIMLALVLAAAANSNAATTCPTEKPAMSTSSDIDCCLMGCLNLDQPTLDRLRSQGWKTPDIVMAAVISMRSGVCIDDVLAQYKSCSNWRDVAKQYNLSVADVMKFRMTSDQNMDAFNKALISQCYSLAECDIAAMRAKGMSWGDICMTANAATRTGQTVMAIADLRSQGMTWEQIACKFNVAPSDICKPAGTCSLAMMTTTYAGAGPVTCPMNVRDSSGNIVMTEDMADRWYRRGYDWLDVAVATNISLQTGLPVMEVLIQLNAGHTWRDLAYYFGVCPEVAFNVCNWPFPRRTIYSQSMNAKNMRMIEKYQNPTQMAGAGPYRAPMSYWLLQRGTWFGNDWCRVCGTPCKPCATPCPAPCPAPCPTK